MAKRDSKRGPKDPVQEHMIHIVTGQDPLTIGSDGWVNDIDNDELVSRVMPAQNRPGSMRGGGTPINVSKFGRNLKGGGNGG